MSMSNKDTYLQYLTENGPEKKEKKNSKKDTSDLANLSKFKYIPKKDRNNKSVLMKSVIRDWAIIKNSEIPNELRLDKDIQKAAIQQGGQEAQVYYDNLKKEIEEEANYSTYYSGL